MSVYMGKDQRRYFRVECATPICTNVSIVKINNQPVNTGVSKVCVEDIGAGGLRFISNLKFPVNRSIIIEFNTIILNEPVTFHGFIIRQYEIEKEIYRYAVQFVIDGEEQEDSDKLLKDLNMRLQNDANIKDSSFCSRNRMACMKVGIEKAEKRAYLRFQCPSPLCATMTVLKINNKVVNSEGEQVCVEDIGLGGLRFLSHVDLPAIKDILYEFRMTILDQRLVVQGSIRRKKEIDTGIYEYGVEFYILDSQRKNIAKNIEAMKARLIRRASSRSVYFCIKDKISCLHSRILIG